MSIKETEKAYYVEVFLGVDPTTDKKIRKTKYFRPKSSAKLKEAKAWEAKIIAAYKTGDLDMDGKMKVSEYLDYWFETCVEANNAYQTQIRYKTFCNCIKKHLGYIDLSKLKTPLIDHFYADLRKEMVTLKDEDKTVKRRYADGTVLKTHKLFKLALDKAVAWGMITRNPADHASPPQDDNHDVIPWSIAETLQFLELIKDSQLYLPVFIAFHTGLREGEICALKWKDINLEENTISVNNNMVCKKGGKLVTEATKTEASKDTIAMTKDLKSELEKVKDYQEALTEINEIEYKFVCCWDDGRAMRPNYLAITFTDFIKKFDYKKLTFHGLRHTHASLLFANGATSQEVSKRLRHTRVATTDDIYIHLNEEIKKTTAGIFDNALEVQKKDTVQVGQYSDSISKSYLRIVK